MLKTPAQTPFDIDADAACEEIVAFDGPVLVDLDETLYLRNSTEDFINCARPALLALVLLRIFDIIKPWRWTGGESTRDVWRVRLVAVLFPWTTRTWKRRVAELAPQYCNTRLAAALRQRANLPIVVTVGFQPLVEPLVAALGFADAKIVAARMSGFEDRRRGKLSIATASLGDDLVRQALVVTDSIEDLPLLQVCARPLRVIWPAAQYRSAFAHVYLPGQYLTQIKRPGQRYIVRGILQEDFAFWVLSSVALASYPLLHVSGLLFLLLSFWVIYERGYVDNDFVAAKFEKAPKLSEEYFGPQVATPRWQPWIWAIGSGGIAITLLSLPTAFQLFNMLKWVAVLLATYLWFKLYNRYDKSTRIWMFTVLQFARSAAFIALVPAIEIGVAALGAHILARWVPYFVYRFDDKGWPNAPFYLVRLLFFLVLALLLLITLGTQVIANWTALSLLLWNGFRARRELQELFTNARRLDLPEQ